MFRRIITAAIALALAITACACAETLRVGMECAYAPFNWAQTEPSENTVALANGSYADGYDVRIAQRIADELGYELEIVPTEWDGLIVGVMTGALDLIIAGMSPTEERLMTIDFSDPYYESDLVIVVRKDSAFANATSIQDFAGATIVGQLNTFHDTVIDQISGVTHATPMDTFPTMIVAVSSGAVDGYVSERPGAESAVATNPDLTYVVFAQGSGFVADPADTTIAVGLAKGSPLTEAVNGVLAGISEEERVQIMGDALAAQPSVE